ncbi:MAG: PKD domain-containing protein [Bacteroidota bacterium]
MKKNSLSSFLKGSLVGLLSLCVILTSITSCKEDDSFEVTPVNFVVNADKTEITVTESINYTDDSKNVAEREWKFQGGDIATSSNVSEEVIYSDTGRFETTLSVTFNDGSKDDRLFFVDIRPFVQTDFSASATTLVFGGEVQFTNLTQHMPAVNSFPDGESFDEEEETWVWEFEGGVPATSTEKNPVVRYPDVGTYKVKLTANRNYPKNSDTEEKVAYIDVVDVAVISPIAVHTCDFGSTLRMTYPETLKAPSAIAADAFTIKADGAELAISSLTLDPDNSSSLVFNLDMPVVDGQSVTVSYSAAGDMKAESGSIFAPLEDFLVENRVVSIFMGNMDFEIGVVGDFPPDWGTWNPTQSINNNEKYKITDADAVTGNNSITWTYDGSGDQWIFDNKTPTSIIGGGMYRVTFWAKSTLDGATLDLRVIESGWASTNDPADFTLTTEWQQYSFDFVAEEAGDNNRKIWWQTPSSTEVYDFFVDDLRMYYLECE